MHNPTHAVKQILGGSRRVLSGIFDTGAGRAGLDLIPQAEHLLVSHPAQGANLGKQANGGEGLNEGRRKDTEGRLGKWRY